VVDGAGDPLSADPRGKVSLDLERMGSDGEWTQTAQRRARLRHGTRFKRSVSVAGSDADRYRVTMSFEGNWRYLAGPDRLDACSY
jgi:hypothetical protein